MPDAERESPERYKAALVSRLQDTAHASSVWQQLVDAGTCSTSRIDLVHNTWMSETYLDHEGKKHIRLGTKPLTTYEADRLIYLPKEHASDGGIIYRFSHELAHEVAGIASRENSFGMFCANIIRMRQAGNGLSALGSLDFYKHAGPAEQAKEDVTELVNMYLIDPAYLRSYLGFLCDQRMAEERRRVGVTDLPSKQVADALFLTIERAFARFKQNPAG